MATAKNKYRVLVVSSGDKIHDYIDELLPSYCYEKVLRVYDAGAARRLLLSESADIVVINTPLPDDFGVELALDLADSTMGVLLLVKSELYEHISSRVEDCGVMTLPKPNTKQAVYSAIRLLTAVSARLEKMEKKNRSLVDKMADIRTVNRAKWLLIENLNMTESDAHYFIEKQAMDMRLSRRETAENIIRTYDK